MFHREYQVNLDSVFDRERLESVLEKSKDRLYSEENAMNEADFEEFTSRQLSSVSPGEIGADSVHGLLAPTAYGKTFMIHYAVQVSLKHPGMFSQPTQVEIDINLDTSRKDHRMYEQILQRQRDHANKIRLLHSGGP